MLPHHSLPRTRHNYQIVSQLAGGISYFPVEVFNILQSVTMAAWLTLTSDLAWLWLSHDKHHQMQIIYLPRSVLLGYCWDLKHLP